jgi:hypothetical protein
MTTHDQMAEPELAATDQGDQITVELTLGEAEALREWLLKANVNGATCLDEPLVNQVVSDLGHRLDAIRAVASVRRELEEAGLDVAHLSGDQVRELARRVSEAARPGLASNGSL